MKKMNAFVSNILVRIIRVTPIILIAIFFRVIIKERLKNGKDRFVFKKQSNRYSLLALDSQRYRGDLDILAQSEKFRVLHISQGWQLLLIKAFLVGKYYVSDIENLDESSKLGKEHKKTLDFIFNVLNKLNNIVDINSVSTVHFKYIADYYWVYAAEKLGIPWIMLYRECNVMSPIVYDMVVSMMRKQNPFIGSHVIVHNKRIKGAFLESNFCPAEKITIASALRMDQLVLKSKQIENNNLESSISKRKKFTLFYFPVDSSMFGSKNKSVEIQKYFPEGDYWQDREKYFSQLHETILELAEENKDIDFVIKPKKTFMHEKSWFFYEKVLSNSSVDVDKLDNYFIDADADVHNLITESSIICGGQSSTTIESLLMRKPIILPIFCDYHKTDYFAQFPWKDYLDLFNVVRDVDSFKSTFRILINSNDISENEMSKRKELYLSCFDDYTGRAVDRYTETIQKVILKANDLD